MTLLNREGKGSAFNYIVIFFLGLLLASNGFLFYQLYQNQKMTEGLRNDAINIIQAYNNLVNTLSQQGVLKASPTAKTPQPTQPAQPTQPVQPAETAPTNTNQ